MFHILVLCVSVYTDDVACDAFTYGYERLVFYTKRLTVTVTDDLFRHEFQKKPRPSPLSARTITLRSNQKSMHLTTCLLLLAYYSYVCVCVCTCVCVCMYVSQYGMQYFSHFCIAFRSFLLSLFYFFLCTCVHVQSICMVI